MTLMKIPAASVMTTGRPRLPTYGAMRMRKMSRKIKFPKEYCHYACKQSIIGLRRSGNNFIGLYNYATP